MNSGGLVGYGIPQVHGVEDKIYEAFRQVEIAIQQNWPTLQTELRNEWVGQDEESYEREFIKKLNDLYGKSKYTSDYCACAMETWLRSWIDFQKKNIIDNAEEVGDSYSATAFAGYKTLEDMDSIESYSSIEVLKASTRTYDDDFRGLKNGKSSAVNLQGKVKDYVDNIKTQISALFSEITSNNAFYGDQTSLIDRVISFSSDAITEINTAVQDLNDILNTLLTLNYGSQEMAVGDDAVSVSDSIDTSTENIASKWTIN